MSENIDYHDLLKGLVKNDILIQNHQTKNQSFIQ